MSRFRIFNLLCLTGFILIGYMMLNDNTSYLSLVLFFLSYILVLIFGSLFISMDFFIESENAGDARYNEIAITFDDGPNTEITPLILEKLNRSGVKGAFFCKGKNIAKHPELVREIHSNGHLIGNHSYNHLNKFPILPLVDMMSELKNTNKAIFDQIGLKPLFFRPPFGVTNPRIKKAVETLQMNSIGWSLRTYDTTKSPEKVIKKIKRNLNGGDIILLHDNHTGVIEVLDFLISYADEIGLKIVSLDKLLKIEAYEK